MRWVPLFALLLLAPWPVAAQEGCDEGIEVDGAPKEGEEEPEPPKSEQPEPGKPPEKPPAATAPTAENINRAIDAGVAWLRKVQKEDGSWGPCIADHSYGQKDAQKKDHEGYPSGPTSFAIFTLAQCGVPEKDAGIRKGLKWLRKKCREDSYITGNQGDFRATTYESASLILMLCALYAPAEVRRPTDNPAKPPDASKFKEDDWAWMHERISHLCVGWKRPKGGGKLEGCQNKGGGWRYYEAKGDQDASATQFVLLALREAVRAGYPLNAVAPDVWKDAAEGARSFQVKNGGFRYQKDYPWSAGMTAASIASLLICKEQLILAKKAVPDWLDGSVADGIKFLGEILDIETNRGDESIKEHRPGYHYYHLYGLERAGVLSGKKEFGGKAWYTRGATFLLSHQHEDGRWEDETCMRPTDVLGTCFALLFLKRATPPPAVTVSGD
jgi:hypothetical protein